MPSGVRGYCQHENSGSSRLESRLEPNEVTERARRNSSMEDSVPVLVPSPEECLRKLTSERLLVTLLTGALIKHPNNALRHSLEFWAVVIPYCEGKSYVSPSLLDALKQKFSRDDLLFYARYLDYSLETMSSFTGEMAGIQLEVCMGRTVTSRSVLGGISKDVSFCFATLDFGDQRQLLKHLSALAGPFVAEMQASRKSEVEDLRSMLSKAAIPDPPVHQAKQQEEKDTLDISGYRAELQHDCDFGYNGDDDLNILADMFAKQGQISAALEAVNEAFIRDRRSLIREMRSGDAKYQTRRSQTLREGSVRRSRELVGCLQTLLCTQGRPESPAPPVALDVPIQQLTQFVAATSTTDGEKVEALLLQLEAEVALGILDPDVLHNLINSKHLLTTLFHPDQCGIVGPFLLVSAQIWLNFGFPIQAKSYCRLLHKAHLIDARPNLGSQLAQMKALQLDEPLEGLLDLATFPANEWCDSTQATYTLIMAWNLTLAHDVETAKFILDQVGENSPPLRILEGQIQTKILILLHESKYYAAFAEAQQRAQYHASKGATYLELVYITWSVRCLVLSEQRLHAAQAQILLDDTLKRALQTSKLGLVIELTVLQARLLYNSGDVKGCHEVCSSLEQLVNASATIKLRCEWKMLTFASSHRLGIAPTIFPDQTELVRSLYTEFSADIAQVAMESELNVLQHTNVQNLHLRGQNRGPQKPGAQKRDKTLSLAIQKVLARNRTVEAVVGNELVYLAYLKSSAASAQSFPSPVHRVRDISTPRLPAASPPDDYNIALKRPLSNGSPQRRTSKRRTLSMTAHEIPK